MGGCFPIKLNLKKLFKRKSKKEEVKSDTGDTAPTEGARQTLKKQVSFVTPRIKNGLPPLPIAKFDEWIVRRTHKTFDPKYRMICLPWAGGNSTIYRSWTLPNAEVVSVELPGRMARLREKPIGNIHIIVEYILQALEGLNLLRDIPLVIFGHSFGCMVGFELTRGLIARGVIPHCLVLSGCVPVHLRTNSMKVSKLSDNDLIKYLCNMGGLPRELADNRDFLDLFLPAIRGDYKAIDSYEYRTEKPLPCPILAMGGTEDIKVSRRKLEQWKVHTSSEFTLEMFPGGHFYLKDVQAGVLEKINQVINRPKSSVSRSPQGLLKSSSSLALVDEDKFIVQ